jgi:alanine racemase
LNTYAEISLGALGKNIKAYADILPEKTKIIAVVKADAYGHGMIAVSKKALECGVHMLAVAQPEEGALLRKVGFDCPIIAMGGMLPGDMEQVVNLDLIPFIYTTEQLLAFERYAGEKHKQVKFHLKIETGMNRIGVLPGNGLEEFLKTLDTCGHVKMTAVCSHFANADETDKEFASEQYQRFVQGIKQVREADYFPNSHMANSAAAASCDFSRLDFIRLGISMYGLQSEELGKMELAPVMTIKTKVVHVKTIEKGETVGYSRTFTARGDVDVATIPIGYADGFRRALSNKGEVLIHGSRAKVIGNVCMDHSMVDVTGIENVKTGDEVVIIGKQGAGEITAQETADWTDTLHYEVVSCVGQRVKRIYKDE